MLSVKGTRTSTQVFPILDDCVILANGDYSVSLVVQIRFLFLGYVDLNLNFPHSRIYLISAQLGYFSPRNAVNV